MSSSIDRHVKYFKLKSVDPNKENPSNIISMDSMQNWVSTFIKSNPWSQMDSVNDYKEIRRNFTSKITHAGFIHYLHLCWAKELGCELRPDIIYYTIISELASEILKDPENYQYLFTDSDEKENIITISEDGIIKADRLIESMRTLVKVPDFLTAICDVKFDSDVKDAHYARKMTFACMGTPFYDYICSLCGIPHLELIGSVDDWVHLHSAVVKLSRFPPNIDKYNTHEKYFKGVINIIANIIYYGFAIIIDTKEHPFIRYIGDQSSDIYDAENFFSDIFDYGKNTKCGSGHPDNLVHGWAKLFYINGMSAETTLEPYISSFSSHVNFIPFTRDFDNKYFCQAVTLAFSELDQQTQTLRPGYGIITYEITNEDTYNKIANPTRKDANGIEYQPLSLKQCKEIIDGGKLYNPAGTRYGNNVYVICDRCRKHIYICIGYGNNNDLCLACADKVRQEWKRIYNEDIVDKYNSLLVVDSDGSGASVSYQENLDTNSSNETDSDEDEEVNWPEYNEYNYNNDDDSRYKFDDDHECDR
jgi:hypothetical protein